MSKFAPSSAEYRFRLVAGVLGVLLTIGASVYLRATSNAHLGELWVFGLGFFGGTVIWSAWKLYKGDHS
jgi:hypothetical protein